MIFYVFSEFGTNFSTLLDNGHPMLPEDPLNSESDWICEKTGWFIESDWICEKTGWFIESDWICEKTGWFTESDWICEKTGRFTVAVCSSIKTVEYS